MKWFLGCFSELVGICFRWKREGSALGRGGGDGHAHRCFFRKPSRPSRVNQRANAAQSTWRSEERGHDTQKRARFVSGAARGGAASNERSAPCRAVIGRRCCHRRRRHQRHLRKRRYRRAPERCPGRLLGAPQVQPTRLREPVPARPTACSEGQAPGPHRRLPYGHQRWP